MVVIMNTHFCSHLHVLCLFSWPNLKSDGVGYFELFYCLAYTLRSKKTIFHNYSVL